MSDWVPVRRYAALVMAEMHQQMLEQSGIPVLLKGPLTGAFGPGFSGPTTEGVTLLVPDEHHATALELLGEEDD